MSIAIIVLTMTICSSSQDALRDRIREMEKQGWQQSSAITFAPCEGWNTAKNGIYEEGECANMYKRERVKYKRGK